MRFEVPPLRLGPDALRRGQLDRELRAAVDLALHINPAAVCFDDLSRRRKSESRPAVFRGKEGLEHVHGRLFVHS